MSSPTRYRLKTQEVAAIQWTGWNAREVAAFLAPALKKGAPLKRSGSPPATLILELDQDRWIVHQGDYIILYEEQKTLRLVARRDFERYYEPCPENDA